MFSHGIPRWAVLVSAIAGLSLVPPETLSGGTNICLWSHLFHIQACPACGSTRALAAFFHGQFSQALTYNKNVLVTAPSLVVMMTFDILHRATRFLRRTNHAILQRRRLRPLA